MELLELPVGLIRVNRDNPRETLGDLTDLAASIRAQGLLQPLIVRRRSEAVYWLLDGHRRFAAAQLAGLRTVPALCQTGNAAVVAVITGGHSRPLRPLEQARGFGQLIEAGCTQAQVVQLTGYSAGYVSSRLALLRLDPESMRRVEQGLVRPEEALAAVRTVRAAAAPAGHRRRAGRASTGHAPYFGDRHPLAGPAAERCTHKRTVRRDGSTVACGECWEATIRADERARAGPDGGEG